MLVRQIITNAATGEVTEQWVEDPNAITEAQGLVVTAQQAQMDTNARSLESQADQALASLRTYRDLAAPSATQTTAQVKLQAKVLIGIIRLLRQKFDGTD